MSSTKAAESSSSNIEHLLDQIRSIGQESPDESAEPAKAPPAQREKHPLVKEPEQFVPEAPSTLQRSGVSDSLLEELICKFLLARSEATGRQISEQVKLPFPIVEQVLSRLKREQTIAYVGQSTMNDYVCKLSAMGGERAMRFSRACTYFGAAPVPLRDYVSAVAKQSLTRQHPSEEDLRRAFSDLLINQSMFDRLGPAVNSGKGMFLYGYPGNGKTSIAERITAAFGEYIWIPRAIQLDSDIVRLYDPMVHVEAPKQTQSSLLSQEDIDQRWIRIRRPTIVVGGELTMEHLEINFNHLTGISEAPVQLKSNCGTLVIDDFGRQRISVSELLNRWIVPLEKRFDFLRTSNGKKIQLPFDQLVIFSTNLEPRDLVDDAFLRRIPYKIEVPNPSREEFTQLFDIIANKMGFEPNRKLIDNLIDKHYLPNERPFRNCHPRDLLLQIKNYCLYKRIPMELSDAGFDFACDNYFSIV